MRHFFKNSILIFIIAASLLAPLSLNDIQQSTLHVQRVYAQEEEGEGEEGKGEAETGCNPLLGPLYSACVAAEKYTAIQNAPAEIFNSIKQGLAFAMLTFSSWLLGIAGLFFDFVLTETVKNMAEFVSQIGAIDVAWRVLRDIVNMAFIFILLYIAIATILRIEEYGARRLLARVILIALLINFSLFFTKAVVDVSNVLSAEFINGIEQIGEAQEGTIEGSIVKIATPGGIAGAFVEPLRLTTIYGGTGELEARASEIQNIFTIGLAGSIFLLVAAFILFAGALLLAIRFLVLIFLMVISPLAFVGMILPKTAEYSRQWWSELFKQAIFAPVYMALLLVVAVIVNDPEFQRRLTGTGSFAELVNNPTSSTGPIGVVLNFVIVSGLMIMALVVAQRMGVQGATALSNLGRRIGVGAAARAFRFVGRKYNEITTDALLDENRLKWIPKPLKRAGFAALNPVAFARGWTQRSEELQRLAQSTAAAGGREVVERTLTTPIFTPRQWIKADTWKDALQTRGRSLVSAQLKIPYRQMDERRDENEFMQDYTEMRKESLMYAAEQATNMTGAEGSLRRRAIVKAAATQGYLDDLLRIKGFAEKYGEKDGTIYSAKTLNRFLYDYLGDDEQAMRFMAEDMEDLGKQAGHYEYLGHAYFNPDTGKFERGFEKIGETDGMGERKIEDLKNTWQGEYASGEIAKVSGRERLRVAPHNFTAIRAKLDAGGNIVSKGNEVTAKDVVFGSADGQLDDFYKQMLGAIDEGDYRELHHSQSRTTNWLLSREFDKNTGELIVDGEDDVKKIASLYHEKPEYIRGLYGKKFGMNYDTARKNLPGIKVAYYKKDEESGVLRKVQSEIRIGNSRGVEHPIVGVVTKTFEKDPDIKIEQFQKEPKAKLKKVVSEHARDIFGGKMKKSDLEAEIQRAVGDNVEWPEGIDSSKIADRVFETVRQTIRDNHDPVIVIKKIDGLLPDDRKLSVTEISELSKKISDAYVSTWKQIAESGRDMDSQDTANELGNAFEAAVRETAALENVGSDLFDRVRGAGGVEMFVEQVRPSKRGRSSGENQQTPDSAEDLGFELDDQ